VAAGLYTALDDSEILVMILDTVATSLDGFKTCNYYSAVALFTVPIA
jgi:hypothetical protein